ncbi:ComEA family DNA-binding protein [Yersinia vastinensis]|uniref:ComEA family DNA-binding protein n=1 Tax=Yersinia vastinensis TaxID=2890318 RepID=UPI0005E12842|nr:ComEA family DNA-binding protein [Yersinia vastinensis]OVZ98372.1 transporter [Yersinia frederiksenii]CNI25460.1 competence protein ComEA [Yersinia frederiksenii]
MKSLGKLFVVTLLLTGLNIHSPAHAVAASSASSSPQEKVLHSSGKVAVSSNASKVVQDKMTVTATADKHSANKASESLQSQIDINRADAEQLAQYLNGVGRKKAEAIVSYREQFGPFTEAEQLLEVPGIGPSFLEKNSTRIKI